MGVFSVFKYFDARYLSKKILGNKDMKEQFAKIVPYIQEKSSDFIKECHSSREKLKDIPGTNYKLGIMHMNKGNIDDAIMRFRMVSFLTPDKAGAYYNLGRCLILAGDNDNATKQFQRVLEIDKKFTDAQYMLDKLEDASKIKSIPTSIIKEKSEILADLQEDEQYSSYKSLVNAALTNITDKNPGLEVLDLGCGNGNCGKTLKKKGVIKKLTGVDISHKRIQQTKLKKIDGEQVYDHLEEKEIRDYLSTNKVKFDLILADLSFNHIGDLTDIAALLKKSMKSKAILAFTIPKSLSETGFNLDIENDSFTYSKKYVKKQFKDNGFKELEIKNISLYEENEESEQEHITIFVYQN